MSKARTCDGCGKTMVLDSRGDDPDGESAAWVRLQIADEVFDGCTRQCTIAILERPDVVKMHDAYTESIMEVARSIRQEYEGDDDSERSEGADDDPR